MVEKAKKMKNGNWQRKMTRYEKPTKKNNETAIACDTSPNGRTADTTAQLTDSTTIQETEPVTEVPESTANQVVFKIQIGKYNTQLPESTKSCSKISVLRKIDQYTDENNYIVYTIGELTNIKDAVKLQNQIRQESVKDAFVIAIKDGKRIPLNEALKLTGQ